MTGIARILLGAWLLLCPALAAAQSSQAEEDKGFLTNLLQENLSSAGRAVRIDGFRGALSSRARIEQLTISDDEGVWLTIRDIVLDWNRSALLSGRVEVEEFTAKSIEMPRLPVTAEEGPAPEAQGEFQIPELPVSVEIGKLGAERIVLGKEVLGQAAELTLEGSIALTDQTTRASIEARRLDGRDGVFEVSAALDPATRVLDLSILAREGPDGIAANLLDVPGKPALELEIAGDAPLSDYESRIRLSADGRERLSGRVALGRTEAGGRRFSVDLAGDVAGLFAPQYADFFGDSVTLTADATRAADGRVVLRELELRARELALAGSFALGPDGWPERLDLTGRIAPAKGERARLPGVPVTLSEADLQLRYDESEGEGWTGALVARDVEHPQFSAPQIALTGRGTITRGEGALPGAATADLDFEAGPLAFTDPELQAALGQQLTGGAQLTYGANDGLQLRQLTLDGADFLLQARADFGRLAEGLETDLRASLNAGDLSRFSGLAGTDLAGAAELRLQGSVTPLTGAFDLRLDGTGEDLEVGVPEADGLLRGATKLTAEARRDETGLTLRALDLSNDALVLSANGKLQSEESRLTFAGRLLDLAALSPDLAPGAGIARLDGTLLLGADRQLRRAEVTAELENPGGGTVRLPLGADIVTLQSGTVDLTFTEASGAFSASAALNDVAHPLGRVADLALDAEGTLRQGAGGAPEAVRAALDFRAEGLAPSDPALAAALGPQLEGRAQVNYDAEGPLRLDRLTLNGTGFDLTANAALDLADPALPAQFTATLQAQDLTRFGALSGRALRGSANLTAEGTAELASGDFDIAASGRAENLGLGEARIDPLLRGALTFRAQAQRENGELRVETLELDSPNLTLQASGALESGVTFDARLRDAALLAPDYPGPLSARGTLRAAGGGYALDIDAQGPGGTSAQVAGTIGPAGRLDLRASGAAPLGLANVAIAPRRIEGTARFDVALRGPAALSSLSGRIEAQDARLAAPNLGYSLQDIDAVIEVTGGRAQLALTAQVASGGRLRVTGPLTLAAPFPAQLEIAVNDVRLRERGLYDSSVSGRVTVEGPLAGGARIGGRLNLGRTEIQVPDSGITALGEIPPITHVDIPPAAARTRARAGLDGSAAEGGGAGTGGGGGGYALDLRIRAENQVFIRGRGLDAELGGEIRLLGTTSNVIPQGRFELLRGRLDLLSQRFDLDEGFAQLQGDFDPYIRLVAVTRTDDLEIRIIVEGLASEPEVRFESSPNLPQDEVLAQLVFGRDLASLSPLQALELASAVATLAGRGGEGVLGRLRKGFGLDDLDITQTEEGNTAVRAGKYLSENVYTDITVDSEGESEINLNLDINRNFTVRGGVGSDGGSGIGLFFEKDY